MRLFFPFLLLAACFAPRPAAGQTEIALIPRSETGKDSSLQVFWDRLTQAAREKDADWIISALSPTVRNTFGDDYGIDSFHEIWQPYSEASPLWDELSEITSLGGTFFDTTLTLFMAPYVYSEWPGEFDTFSFGAITGISVPMYSGPDSGTDVLKVLSYDIVAVGHQPPSPEGWQLIELLDGTPGYVADGDIRRPTDYRIGIERFPGGWEIVFLLAGD